jgi:hypothetical protein
MDPTSAPTSALQATTSAPTSARATAPTSATSALHTQPPTPYRAPAPLARGHKHRPSSPHSDTAALSLRSRPNARAVWPQACQSIPEPSPLRPCRDVPPATTRPAPRTRKRAFTRCQCRHVRAKTALGTCFMLAIEREKFHCGPTAPVDRRSYTRALLPLA